MRRSPMKRTASRGSGIPPKVREAVLMRDGHHCRRCGVSVLDVPASVHHRLPRGRGGQPTLSTLVLLCGSGTTGCHGRVESDRWQAYDDGWLIRTGEDPAQVPALTPDGWRYFPDDGRVLTASAWRREFVVAQEVTR